MKIKEPPTSDLTRLPLTPPDAVYRPRDAAYAVDLLIAALVQLDLFTRIAERPRTFEAVCKDLGLQSRPADVMVALFLSMGLLRREGDILQVTPVAGDHLVKGSPWYLGPYYASFKDRPVARDFVEVLRTGKPAGWAGGDKEKAWAEAMEDAAFAESFTAAMDCRGAYLGALLAKAFDFAGTRRLLDIAGGSGIYACCACAEHPHMTAAVFEKPPVDRVSRASIERRGFSQRVKVIAGDMFVDALPRGFDVHLYSNVLHDWDIPRVKGLLATSFAALDPGGTLIVHDAHLESDKTGPLPVAEYSALLMHTTEGRCYSIAEMEALLSAAGFVDVAYTPTGASRSLVTARKP